MTIHRMTPPRGRPPADWQGRKTELLSHMDSPRTASYLSGLTGMSHWLVGKILGELEESGHVELSGPGRNAIWRRR